MLFSKARTQVDSTLQWQRWTYCRDSRALSVVFRSAYLYLPFITPLLGLLTLSRNQYQQRMLFNLQSILRKYLRGLNISTTREPYNPRTIKVLDHRLHLYPSLSLRLVRRLSEQGL